MIQSKYSDEQLYGHVTCEHMGHAIRFGGNSYSCPALKLFGYAYEDQVKRAIARKLKAADSKKRKEKRI